MFSESFVFHLHWPTHSHCQQLEVTAVRELLPQGASARQQCSTRVTETAGDGTGKHKAAESWSWGLSLFLSPLMPSVTAVPILPATSCSLALIGLQVSVTADDEGQNVIWESVHFRKLHMVICVLQGLITFYKSRNSAAAHSTLGMSVHGTSQVQNEFTPPGCAQLRAIAL